MNEYEIREVCAAYQRGKRSDMLQTHTNGVWGAIWMIPPCSSDHMERAGRQFTRARAAKVRHTRRAILKRNGTRQDVVVVTELPARRQIVISLLECEQIEVRRYLTDEALTALEAAFIPYRRVAR